MLSRIFRPLVAGFGYGVRYCLLRAPHFLKTGPDFGRIIPQHFGHFKGSPQGRSF